MTDSLKPAQPKALSSIILAVVVLLGLIAGGVLVFFPPEGCAADDDPGEEREVNVAGSGLWWVRPGDTVFVGPILFIYEEGDVLEIRRNEHLYEIGGRQVGLSLRSLPTGAAVKLLDDHRSTVYAVSFGTVDRLDPRLVAALGQLETDRLTVSVTFTQETPGLESLEPVADRIVGLDVGYQLLELERDSPLPEEVGEHLERFSNLTYLVVHSDPLSPRSVERISRLPRLRALKIACRDEAVAHLAGHPRLDKLLIARELTDRGVEHVAGIAGLRSLSLIYTDISDAGVAHLARLEHLRSLTLTRARLTDQGLAHISGHTKLLSLDINETSVTDAGLASLSRLENLRRLNLSATAVTDDGLAHVAQLRSLRVLSLNWTKVTDAGMTHIAALTHLRDLMMLGTRVGDSGLAKLAHLPDLRTVAASKTKITEAGAKAFREAHPEVRLTR